MSNNLDLESVISDAVNDSTVDDAPVETSADTSAEPVAETPEVADVAADTSTPDVVEEPAKAEEPVSAEVTPPTNAQTAAPANDDFESLVGIPAVGVGGRENRIPYSRVKKITEKAVGEVVEAVTGRKLAPGEKAIDVVKAHIAKLPELETKVTDYESRLQTVGEFEEIMANQPQRFLQMLSRVPAYKEFFDVVEQAYQSRFGGSQPQVQQSVAQPQVAGEDAMPEPNEELPDGTKVYNMEGLQELLAWNAKQVESRVTRQIEERYKPIESEWQERRRIETTLPIVRAQIAEAKTWPLFDENEDEITKVLEADPNISLEGAYRKVVFPKLVAERNTMRQQVLQEVHKAPVRTSVAGARAVPTKPAAPVATGPRSLEDIIKESMEQLRK